jgi:hypothetical protein
MDTVPCVILDVCGRFNGGARGGARLVSLPGAAMVAAREERE